MKLYFLILAAAACSACVGMAFEPWESGTEVRPWGQSFKGPNGYGDWRDQFGR